MVWTFIEYYDNYRVFENDLDDHLESNNIFRRDFPKYKILCSHVKKQWLIDELKNFHLDRKGSKKYKFVKAYLEEYPEYIL